MSDLHRLVEIVHPDFEFYHKDKPSGHYMRGLVIEGSRETEHMKIKSFSNGRIYKIDPIHVVFLDEPNKKD